MLLQDKKSIWQKPNLKRLAMATKPHDVTKNRKKDQQSSKEEEV